MHCNGVLQGISWRKDWSLWERYDVTPRASFCIAIYTFVVPKYCIFRKITSIIHSSEMFGHFPHKHYEPKHIDSATVHEPRPSVQQDY